MSEATRLIDQLRRAHDGDPWHGSPVKAILDDVTAEDAAWKWDHFRRAFETSGLATKHRGIIVGLARHRERLDLPPEYDHFLTLFTSATPLMS